MSVAFREIDDPVFGHLRLQQESIWIGRIALSPFGEVGIRVDRWDDSVPDERQRAMFEQYRHEWTTLAKESLERVASYCSTYLRPVYAEVFEPTELEGVLPEGLNARWVAENVSHAEIVVPADAYDVIGRPLDVSIYWQCSWDPEHGIGVTICDGVVISVGQPCGLG